ncbi:hypothetical protein AB0271_11370 [Kocuria palustris]|uniref:hypothetical protein n=1 Tax=Kocuria palustris TaxID=71999 RepID=UPI003450DD3F
MPEIPSVAFEELGQYDVQAQPADVRTRLDVVVDGVVVPLILVRRSQAHRLVVLSNGAVDQERAAGQPIFQRSSWSDEIRHHQIYVYDPATGAPDFLSLAWGNVSSTMWAPEAISRIVKTLSQSLGVRNAQDRMYFGSSAGGFMSLALLSEDPGARAVINNAQFDWTRWMATGVNALRRARFEGMLPADIRTAHPMTTNVLDRIAEHGDPVRIEYHVNVASTHDRKQDLGTFQDFVVRHPELCADVRVHHYFDPVAGHNPLAQADTLSLINQAFEGHEHPLSRGRKDRTATEAAARSIDEFPGLTWSPAETPDFMGAPETARHDVVDRSGELNPIHTILQRVPGADTLVVALHGMLDRKKQAIPNLSRFQELEDLPQHLLVIADPTLHVSEQLRVGWYIGTESDPVADRVAELIREAAHQLGVQKILVTGSAAGGFAALALAARVPGSLALAFSPQTDIRRYANGGPARLLAKCAFPSSSGADGMVADHPQRGELDGLYGRPSSARAWYVQNSGDEVNLERHMAPFRAAAGDRVEFVLEHHCRGFNPPTAQRIRSWIDFACAHFQDDPQPHRLPDRGVES